MPPHAGPSRLGATEVLGVSFKDTVDTIASFLEVVIHTILCIRAIYPPATFTRRRAHGVPVYQSRHPEVRGYVANVVAAMQREMERGTLRRMTLIVRQVESGLPLERYIVDFGYMGLEGMEGAAREAGILNAPTPDDLSSLLRGFLVRLASLDGQLTDLTGETTFAIVVETNDQLEPGRDGEERQWVPALKGDVLDPLEGHHEPLLSVRAVETGVVDLRMMVQECVAKTGDE